MSGLSSQSITSKSRITQWTMSFFAIWTVLLMSMVKTQETFERFSFRVDGVTKDDTLYSKLLTTSEFSSAQQAWFPDYDYFTAETGVEVIFNPESEYCFRNQSIIKIISSLKVNSLDLPFLILS